MTTYDEWKTTNPADEELEARRRKIVTSHVYPPIPTRRFDWCAYYEGEEERGCHGWGETEEEAVTDLTTNDPDHDEPDEPDPLASWTD